MPDNGSEMRACSGLPELWRSIHQRVGYRRVAQRCRRAGQDWSASGDSTIRSRLILFYMAANVFQLQLARTFSGKHPRASVSDLTFMQPALTTAQQSRTALAHRQRPRAQPTTNGRWGYRNCCPQPARIIRPRE